MRGSAAGSSAMIAGPQRASALRDFRRQMRRWGYALPKAELRCLDFGRSDFARVGLIEYWIADEAETGYRGRCLFVFRGQACPRHRHWTKHRTFFLVRGCLYVVCGGRRRVLRPGDALALRQGMGYRFTGLEPALLLELSSESEGDDVVLAGRLRPSVQFAHPLGEARLRYSTPVEQPDRQS